MAGEQLVGICRVQCGSVNELRIERVKLLGQPPCHKLFVDPCGQIDHAAILSEFPRSTSQVRQPTTLMLPLKVRWRRLANPDPTHHDPSPLPQNEPTTNCPREREPEVEEQRMAAAP